MNQHETPVARALLDIANSDHFATRRLQAFQHYSAISTMQTQIDTEIRGIQDPNIAYSDYARRRNAIMAQASDRSLDSITRALAQQQLDALIEGYNSKPHSYSAPQKPIDVERLLSTDGMVMYGSRALNVNRNSSDYDLAFSYESHRFIYNYLRESNTPISNSTEYFTSAPEAGYHTFFKYANDTKIDIIFVHNDEDLDVIRSSIQDLQSIPSYTLHDKLFRIEAYNKALQHRGWKSKVLIEPRPRARGTSTWF